jgi:hypothetical protein
VHALSLTILHDRNERQMNSPPLIAPTARSFTLAKRRLWDLAVTDPPVLENFKQAPLHPDL